jgi:hypothetical protein
VGHALIAAPGPHPKARANEADVFVNTPYVGPCGYELRFTIEISGHVAARGFAFTDIEPEYSVELVPLRNVSDYKG